MHRDKECRKTIRKLCAGIAKPLTRVTQKLNTTSATCTTTVEGCHGIVPRPSVGTTKAADQGDDYAHRALGFKGSGLSILGTITLSAMFLWCLRTLKDALLRQ